MATEIRDPGSTISKKFYLTLYAACAIIKTEKGAATAVAPYVRLFSKKLKLTVRVAAERSAHFYGKCVKHNGQAHHKPKEFLPSKSHNCFTPFRKGATDRRICNDTHLERRGEFILSDSTMIVNIFK